MLFSFAAMVGGFFFIFRGIDAIGCRSVSFSRSFTTCYQSDLGALSGPVAGTILIAIGLILFFGALVRFATVR